VGLRGLLASLLVAATTSGAALGAPAAAPARHTPPTRAPAHEITVGVTPTPRSPGVTPYIVGGNAASLSSWPYLVAVVNPEGLCTGELVGARWVLTARHCVSSEAGAVYTPGLMRVTVGSGALFTRRNWETPLRIVAYPHYTLATAIGDLALIELRYPTTRQTVELATTDPNPAANWTVRIAGWGLTSDFGLTPNAAQAADTVLWNQTYCAATEPAGAYDPSTELCAGGPNQSGDSQYPSVCSGDSGGPLVLPGTGGSWTDRLLGITDYGSPLGCDAFPSVFQDIPAHLGWLVGTTGLAPVPILRAHQTAGGRTIATVSVWLRAAEARTTVELLSPGGTVASTVRAQAWHRAPVRLTVRGLPSGAQLPGYRVITVNAYGTGGGVPVTLQTLRP